MSWLEIVNYNRANKPLVSIFSDAISTCLEHRRNGVFATQTLRLAFLQIRIILLCDSPTRNTKRYLRWVMSHESKTTCFKGEEDGLEDCR